MSTLTTSRGRDQMLSLFPFAASLSPGSRTALERELLSFNVDGRQQLIQKGDTVGGVYLVTEGALRVYAISPSGRESTLYMIQPGESCILAMNCVFSDILYPAWVESEPVNTKIAVIPSQVYRRMHEGERAVQRFTFDVLSARIFDLMATLEDATTLPLDRRLANFVLKRADSSMRLAMSHEEIASHLGTAREVISRHLRSFENAGLVNVARGYTEIASAEGLRQFIYQ